MNVIWDDGGWLIPAEVHAKLETATELRYTTILTTLIRLYKKGRLERRREGRAFAYHASLTRSEWSAGRMDEVLRLAGDRTATLSGFVECLSDADRTELRRLLRGERKR